MRLFHFEPDRVRNLRLVEFKVGGKTDPSAMLLACCGSADWLNPGYEHIRDYDPGGSALAVGLERYRREDRFKNVRAHRRKNLEEDSALRSALEREQRPALVGRGGLIDDQESRAVALMNGGGPRKRPDKTYSVHSCLATNDLAQPPNAIPLPAAI